MRISGGDLNRGLRHTAIPVSKWISCHILSSISCMYSNSLMYLLTWKAWKLMIEGLLRWLQLDRCYSLFLIQQSVLHMHSCCNHSRSRSYVPVFNYFSLFAYLLSFPLLLLLTQIISVNQSRILTSWLPTVAPQTRRYSPLSAYRALRITRVLRGGLTYWVLQPPSLTDLLCQTAKHL